MPFLTHSASFVFCPSSGRPVLGLPYDFNVDLWSTAVTLFELYTGRIMFPGKTNNEMLRLIMETRGRIPNRVVRRGTLRHSHFDDQCNFLYHDVDKVTQKVIIPTTRPHVYL